MKTAFKASTTLPHQADRLFITDGGQETTLVFHEGIDLPCFAAFDLLKRHGGREWFLRYFDTYIALAHRYQTGFVLESVTWRANPDWAAKLGYTPEELKNVNREAIGLLHEIRERHETETTPMVVSAVVGPRGDGYVAGQTMSHEESAAYHGPQIRTYRDAGADVVSAMTMTSVAEALGIAEAAGELEIPCVISFTLETDGRLPDGNTLQHAIATVDACAKIAPAYYMINCAHPTHFTRQLEPGAEWLSRIVGVRANASCRSHAELDASTDLDAGNPPELGEQYRELRRILPNLNVLGGCCGTDHRHIEAICEHCVALQLT